MCKGETAVGVLNEDTPYEWWDLGDQSLSSHRRSLFTSVQRREMGKCDVVECVRDRLLVH